MTAVFANAQTTNKVENHQFKVDFIAPGFNYELGLNSKNTINFGAGIGFGFRSSSELGSDFGFYPAGEIQYRHYYNLKRRANKGKNTFANSGNYIAAAANYTSGRSIFGDLDLAYDNYLFIGPVYGLQRTYGKGFNFGLEFGAGYYQNDVDGGISLLADFSIGWVFGKKRKN